MVPIPCVFGKYHSVANNTTTNEKEEKNTGNTKLRRMRALVEIPQERYPRNQQGAGTSRHSDNAILDTKMPLKDIRELGWIGELSRIA